MKRERGRKGNEKEWNGKGEGSCFSTPEELESQVSDPLLPGMPDIVPAPLFPSLPEVTEGC